MNPIFPTAHQVNLYNLVPPPPPGHQQLVQQMPPVNHHGPVVGSSPGQLNKNEQRMLGESDAARAKRLAKNAERMRQKRASAAAAAAAAASAGQNYAVNPAIPGPQPPPPPLQQQPQHMQQQPVLYNLTPGQMPQLQQIPPAQPSQQVPAVGTGGTPKGYLRGETEEARQKRLAKNAERMRQKRYLEKQTAVAQPVSTAAPVAVLPANPTYVTLQPNVYLTLTQTPAPAPVPPAAPPAPIDPSQLTKAQRRMLGESIEARAKRLAKNAERMRQKRSNQTYEEYRAMLARNAERMRQKRQTRTFEEYRIALAKNAESNRRRRANETPEERALRHMRNAMRQRLRRAMETPEQKAIRKARLAQRMREIRANESYEQRQVRLAKGAARARQRFLNETPEERTERNRRKAEYARLCRSPDPRKKQQQQDQPPSIMEIKAEHQQQATSSTTTIPPSLETPIPGYPINYSEFGAAFPSFLNYPMKNGTQQVTSTAAFNPSYSLSSTTMAGQPPYPYPELTVPTPVMAAGSVKSEKPKAAGGGKRHPVAAKSSVPTSSTTATSTTTATSAQIN